jgi:hypothetical protein
MGEPTVPLVNGTPIRFSPNDWTDVTDVGLMGNAGYGIHETRADFDYLRFGDVDSLADCERPQISP